MSTEDGSSRECDWKRESRISAEVLRNQPKFGEVSQRLILFWSAQGSS